MPVRTWPDFLALGITEIREYGATSIQVTRRLRALLEELGELVLPENRAAVDEEVRRLDATVAASYASSIDLDGARAPDHQGIGGPAAARGRPGRHGEMTSARRSLIGEHACESGPPE